MDEIRAQADPDVVIMLVGNKVDLAEEDPTARRVPFEHGSEFAAEHLDRGKFRFWRVGSPLSKNNSCRKSPSQINE